MSLADIADRSLDVRRTCLGLGAILILQRKGLGFLFDTGQQMKDLGLSLAPAAKFPGAGDEGVVITEVDPSSDAADKGLKPGDVILQVAGLSVSDPSGVVEGVKKAMTKAKTDQDTVKVLMQVKSGDQKRFVALSLKKA